VIVPARKPSTVSVSTKVTSLRQFAHGVVVVVDVAVLVTTGMVVV